MTKQDLAKQLSGALWDEVNVRKREEIILDYFEQLLKSPLLAERPSDSTGPDDSKGVGQD